MPKEQTEKSRTTEKTDQGNGKGKEKEEEKWEKLPESICEEFYFSNLKFRNLWKTWQMQFKLIM